MDGDNVPRVNTFCCGLFPLKTGTYIIGILTFIIELGGHGFFLTYYSLDGIIYKIYITLIIFGLIASGLLILGVLYRKRQFVLIFLIVYLLLLIATIVLVWWSILEGTNYGYYVNDIVGAIIYCLLIAYCLMVVYSYYVYM